MAFENEFLTMMPELVSVSPFYSRDAYGTLVYGQPLLYRARIVGRGIALRRSMNEDNAVIYDVYTDGVPVDTDRVPIEDAPIGIFTIQDKVILPADIRWEDQEPEVFSVGRYTDEGSFHHYLIQLGFMYHRQSA